MSFFQYHPNNTTDFFFSIIFFVVVATLMLATLGNIKIDLFIVKPKQLDV